MSSPAIYPCPKPGKTRKPGVILRGEREICRTTLQWAKRRSEVFLRDKALCQMCGKFAPFHDVLDEDTGCVKRFAGSADHIKERKMGGGERDDSLQNLRWLCHRCHQLRHVPAKVVPAKERA